NPAPRFSSASVLPQATSKSTCEQFIEGAVHVAPHTFECKRDRSDWLRARHHSQRGLEQPRRARSALSVATDQDPTCPRAGRTCGHLRQPGDTAALESRIRG